MSILINVSLHGDRSTTVKTTGHLCCTLGDAWSPHDFWRKRAHI